MLLVPFVDLQHLQLGRQGLERADNEVLEPRRERDERVRQLVVRSEGDGNVAESGCARLRERRQSDVLCLSCDVRMSSCQHGKDTRVLRTLGREAPS